MMVVGGIIGAGIFLNPAIVAQRVGTAGATMFTWGIGALIAIVGAFVFAELGARAPRAGGGYVYLRDAFGPFAAFLYGWALFLMVSTGAIAAVAMTFASYATALVGWPAAYATPLACGALVTLTLVNILGVTPGAITQNVATVLKLAAIGFLVIVAFIAPQATHHDLATTLTAPSGAWQWTLAIGAALVPVLFAFGGWQQTNFIAEELRNPERDLPRALILGVLVVVACYLLVNLAYLRALGVDGLAASRAPAADTVGAFLGERGRAIIGAGIVISTFGFLNLVILVTPRVYQAMAADGLFFRADGEGRSAHAHADCSASRSGNLGDRSVVFWKLRSAARLRRLCRLGVLRCDCRDTVRVSRERVPRRNPARIRARVRTPGFDAAVSGCGRLRHRRLDSVQSGQRAEGQFTAHVGVASVRVVAAEFTARDSLKRSRRVTLTKWDAP